MRIEKVEIQNVGVFNGSHKVTFPKRKNKSKAEIHVFTGPNMSGKSTLLHALVSGFNFHKESNGACSFTSNNLSMKMKKETSYINITTDICDKINVVRCPKDAEHLHVNTNCPQINDYHRQLSNNFNPNYVHDFALFAYPGHRIELINKVKYSYFYPGLKNSNKQVSISLLSESLEFDKSTDLNIDIESWIKEILLKNSYKKDNKLYNKDEYSILIQKITMSLNQIFGRKFDFELDERLERVKLKFESASEPFSFFNLSDGVKCLISWILDLCMYLDKLTWANNLPILERPFVLFLDEVDLHLHIAWQRMVLPIIEDLFPKAQVFITTHSPFVVNSIDGAWIYKLELQDDLSVKIQKPKESKTTETYDAVIQSIFDIKEDYGPKTNEDIEQFKDILKQAYLDLPSNIEKLLTKSKTLAKRDESLKNRILFELKQLSKIKNELLEI